MSTSDTPKTDEALKTGTSFTVANLCRKFERELRAMTVELEKLRASWGLKEIERHREQERAERAEKDAEKDAERYRWFKWAAKPEKKA